MPGERGRTAAATAIRPSKASPAATPAKKRRRGQRKEACQIAESPVEPLTIVSAARIVLDDSNRRSTPAVTRRQRLAEARRTPPLDGVREAPRQAGARAPTCPTIVAHRRSRRRM